MSYSTNIVGIVLKLYFCVFITFLLISETEGISCWQCGVFHRGIRDECWKADQQKHNCSACLKTYTRVYLHDSWRKLMYTFKESKTCIPTNSYKRSAGCYTKTSGSGYMQQCYCYDSFCNAGSSSKYSLYVLTGFLSVLLIL